jgi:hypothetical protein
MEYDPEEYGLQVIECSDPLSMPASPARMGKGIQAQQRHLAQL